MMLVCAYLNTCRKKSLLVSAKRCGQSLLATTTRQSIGFILSRSHGVETYSTASTHANYAVGRCFQFGDTSTTFIQKNHRRSSNDFIVRGIQTKTSITKLQANNNENVDSENIIEHKSKEELSQYIKEAYIQSDTDGILDIAPDLHKLNLSGSEMISLALDAVSQNKGQAAGILNAYIASCRTNRSSDDQSKKVPPTTNHDVRPDIAWDMYTTWEEQAEEIGLYPDLVTFCSTYSVMIDSLSDENKEFYTECAMQVLERAERYTKKITGSKRRKLLVSLSRRKQEHTNIAASDHIEKLKSNYGEDFHILFENDDCIVVSKPSGMICFHTHKTTDGKIRKQKSRNKKKNQNEGKNDNDENKADISLEDALIDIGISLSTLNPDALGIVHRIDRGTSGCIILAKNNDAHARLVTNFFTRCAKKSYMALLPYSSEASMEEEHIESFKPSGILSHDIGGKSALSHYHQISSYGTDARLVNVETKTGRKHQVRVHCAVGLGRPIFLDPIYSPIMKENLRSAATTNRKGNSKKIQKKNEPSSSSNNIEMKTDGDFLHTILDPSLHQNGQRFFLHASSLEIDEFDINVSSELPQWWNVVIEKLII